MDYRNSIQEHWSLTSQFRGPRILNFAGNGDEEAEAAAKAAEEAAAAEAAKAAEEEAAKAEAEAAAKAAEEEEDPLLTPNTFEEGTPEHTAFERQREKFKQKLAKETDAARKSAAGDISGKLDELLATLSTVTKPKPATPPEKKEEEVEITDQDVQIVTRVLKQVGLDPAEAARERQRKEVSAALAKLREENPGVEFNDLELVKFANDNGISQLGGPVYNILELAFYRKHKDTLKKGATPPPPPPPPKDQPKKEPVKIQKGNTGKQPAGDDTKPTGMAAWKQKIMQKYAGSGK